MKMKRVTVATMWLLTVVLLILSLFLCLFSSLFPCVLFACLCSCLFYMIVLNCWLFLLAWPLAFLFRSLNCMFACLLIILLFKFRLFFLARLLFVFFSFTHFFCSACRYAFYISCFICKCSCSGHRFAGRMNFGRWSKTSLLQDKHCLAYIVIKWTRTLAINLKGTANINLINSTPPQKRTTKRHGMIHSQEALNFIFWRSFAFFIFFLFHIFTLYLFTP